MLHRFFLIMALLAASVGLAQAGTFDTPRFVNPGDFAVGLEPVLTFSDPASVGFNARFKYGVSDLSNAVVFVGTGTTPRMARAGGIFTFDFFPDLENQPGIGVFIQGAYYQLPDTGTFELTGTPYIHKTFKSGNQEFEPFLALPAGIALLGGPTYTYNGLFSISVGSIFKGPEHFKYVIEFGWGVHGADSYVSGGVSYYR